MSKKGVFYLKLHLEAGSGGDGVISWERNRYNSRMGPAGGDGGNGASILLQVDSKLLDFDHINVQKFKAQNGSSGQKSSKHGKSASNLTIKVPRNTEIYDLDKRLRISCLGESESNYLACRGGRGGRGNKSFRSAKLQSPWLYELGEKGEKKEILLKVAESSLIAFIDFCNSGSKTSEIFDQSLLMNSKIELLPLLTSDLKKYPEAINFCKACLFLLRSNDSDHLNDLELIESFLTKFSQLKILTILIQSDSSWNEEKKILSRYGDILSLPKREFGSENLTQRLISFAASITPSLPLLSPRHSHDSEYVEYSDELFPDKAKLKILRTKEGWEVNSQTIAYWGSRIPQTTIHNIERLKLKIKLEDIMKQLKKIGGEKGEKLKVGVFETEIY